MRLTLRTLLAYLDDVLEPAQTKEIGLKIQESPVAATLVSRVREVIRRRRLGAPDLEGAGQGIDPNIVAQYLDNTLQEDRVSDVERVCLESDQHLAEVAACHQILTLVIGDPQELTPDRLDRMYALGPVPGDALGGPPSPSSVAVRSPAADLNPAGANPFRDSLPDYLKPSPWSQRMAPVALIAVVVVAAVLALALDRDLTNTVLGLRTAQTEKSDSPTAIKPTTEPGEPIAANAQPTESLPPNGATATVAMANPAAEDQPISVLPEGIDPPPPPDQPARSMVAGTTNIVPVPEPMTVAAVTPTPTTVSTVPTTPPEKPNPTVPPATSPLPAAPMPMEPPVTAPPAIRVPMRYLSTDGILMRFNPEDGHWWVQPRRSELHPGEVFGCPDPFEATLELDGGALQATLLVDTIWKVLPATPDCRIRFELTRGRVLLDRKPGENSAAPLKVEVQAGPRLWTLELAAGTTRCALDMQPARPMGQPLPEGVEAYRLACFAPRGVMVAKSADHPDVTIPSGEMVWLNRPKTDSNALSDPLPAWLDADRRMGTTTLRRYAMLFEREFDADTPVDLSIPALAKDPRPKIAELATRCLATTGSYSALVAALVRSEHPEARAAAAQGLRGWLVGGPERVVLLEQELGLHYPDEESVAVFQLLIGYSEKDARDEQISLQLVDRLRSNFVEVRELAIEQLEFLTGRRNDYRATGAPSQREPAIQRWLSHIEREGALVKPE
ncbi:hypothetical protein GC163_18660 [bacterium]|nr:hypothetical protein [bacterium]